MYKKILVPLDGSATSGESAALRNSTYVEVSGRDSIASRICGR